MIARAFALVAAWAALLAIGAPAHAEWYEASSDNFVIYADVNEEDMLAFADQLERYHSAVEAFTGRTLDPPSPSNRVTVFVVGSRADVRRLAGNRDIAGFYIARPSGSVAFLPNFRRREGTEDLSILLHEYAHHFIALTDRFARPLWMSEGEAEFLSAARFMEDGSVLFGVPPYHRILEIFFAKDDVISTYDLLRYDPTAQQNRRQPPAVYGKSWLLYHYLTMNEERAGELDEYWLRVLNGTPSVEAGEEVFGNLSMLDQLLDRHWRDRESITPFRIEPDQITTGDISLRALSDGEAAMMDIRFQTQRGISREDAADLADDARAIASRHAEDPYALTILAEAEYAAGNDGGAIDAADRAIARNPELTAPYVYKGLALFRMAREMSDPEQKRAAYERAMEPFLALNRLENDHTLPLIYLFRSYVEQGAVPSEEAQAALFRAAELAPFDQELWLIVGMMHMNDGRIVKAREALLPIATDPHGGEKARQVRDLLAFLATKQEGEAVPILGAIAAYYAEE